MNIILHILLHHTQLQVCRMLADKNHVKRDTCWGLVELLPELHMERAYEDHELLVENLLMWKVHSFLLIKNIMH